MQQHFAGRDTRLRFFIGDVRDRDRLDRAMHGVNIVVHAAAMKQVPACEYNPFEAVKTNVMGTGNVIDAAINAGVERVVLVSTDKAVNPVNLYGATKLCAEKLFINGNAYSVSGGTKFSVVRYGNVVGSRGSVVPLFLAQRSNGSLTITDERMTRFWITLEQGVEFVIRSLAGMKGGEIFVPKIPSMRIVDMARAIAGKREIKTIGIRPGEKINELLISEDEARNTLEFEDRFIVMPQYTWWASQNWADGTPLPDGFRYSSDGNTQWLTMDDFCTKLQLPSELVDDLKEALFENRAVASSGTEER
jgi:UDP-N-acetylglucosamine 4,6-dehydratase